MSAYSQPSSSGKHSSPANAHPVLKPRPTGATRQQPGTGGQEREGGVEREAAVALVDLANQAAINAVGDGKDVDMQGMADAVGPQVDGEDLDKDAEVEAILVILCYTNSFFPSFTVLTTTEIDSDGYEEQKQPTKGGPKARRPRTPSPTPGLEDADDVLDIPFDVPIEGDIPISHMKFSYKYSTSPTTTRRLSDFKAYDELVNYALRFLRGEIKSRSQQPFRVILLDKRTKEEKKASEKAWNQRQARATASSSKAPAAAGSAVRPIDLDADASDTPNVIPETAGSGVLKGGKGYAKLHDKLWCKRHKQCCLRIDGEDGPHKKVAPQKVSMWQLLIDADRATVDEVPWQIRLEDDDLEHEGSAPIKPDAAAVPAPPAADGTPVDAAHRANAVQAAMAAQMAGFPLFPGSLPYGFPAYPPMNPFVQAPQVHGPYYPYANPYAWDPRPNPQQLPSHGRHSPPPLNEYAVRRLPYRDVEPHHQDRQPAEADPHPARHTPALDERRAVEVGHRRPREPETPEKAKYRELPRDFPVIKDWLTGLDEGDRSDGRNFSQYIPVFDRLGLHRIIELTKGSDVANRLMGEGLLYGVASAIVDYAREDVEDIRKEKRGQAATPKRQRYS